MAEVFFAPDLEFRIAYCEKTERNVLQVKDNNEWICLHEDTLEEEQHNMELFLAIIPDGTLRGQPGICIGDLELIQGHLVNPEMGIDVCLWPTQPGDKADKVCIRE